jgi:hypothetical protein
LLDYAVMRFGIFAETLAWDKCGTAVTFGLQKTLFLTLLFPPPLLSLLLTAHTLHTRALPCLGGRAKKGPTGFHSKRRFGRPLQPSAAAAAAGQHDFGTPFGTPMHGHGTPANKKMTYNILQEFQSPRPDVKGACGSRPFAS